MSQGTGQGDAWDGSPGTDGVAGREAQPSWREQENWGLCPGTITQHPGIGGGIPYLKHKIEVF